MGSFNVTEYPVLTSGKVINGSNTSMTIKNYGPNPVYVQAYTGSTTDLGTDSGAASDGSGFRLDLGEAIDLPCNKAILNMQGSDHSEDRAYVYVIGRS